MALRLRSAFTRREQQLFLTCIKDMDTSSWLSINQSTTGPTDAKPYTSQALVTSFDKS